jgi:hypothetical protein
MLYFRRNQSGDALAESQRFQASHPVEWVRIMAYLHAVDLGGRVATLTLRQGVSEPALSPAPALHWWDVRGVGVFLTYDGADTVVVLMGVVRNPPRYGDLLNLARGRF